MSDEILHLEPAEDAPFRSLMRQVAKRIKRNRYIFPPLYRSATWAYDNFHPRKVTIRGMTFHLDKRDTLRLALNREWEPSITQAIQEFVKPDWTCVDVGAHIGYHALEMGRYAKHVWAYEPEPSNFALLERNVIANHMLGKVNPCPWAIGGVEASVHLTIDPKSSGGHHLGSKGLDIPMYPLYNLFERDLKLLKIDVEGEELAVLLGLGEKVPDVIILEACEWAQKRAGHSTTDLWDFLIPDYNIWRLVDSGRVPDRLRLLSPIPFLERDYNWLCVRKDLSYE
jgi:FkbM family methyltransferase